MMISKNISTPWILIVQETWWWHLCRHRRHSPRNFGLACVPLDYFFFGFAACLNFWAGTCFFHSPALEKNAQVLPILLLILICLPIHSNKCSIYSCLYDAKEIFAKIKAIKAPKNYKHMVWCIDINSFLTNYSEFNQPLTRRRNLGRRNVHHCECICPAVMFHNLNFKKNSHRQKSLIKIQSWVFRVWFFDWF